MVNISDVKANLKKCRRKVEMSFLNCVGGKRMELRMSQKRAGQDTGIGRCGFRRAETAAGGGISWVEH